MGLCLHFVIEGYDLNYLLICRTLLKRRKSININFQQSKKNDKTVYNADNESHFEIILKFQKL